MARERQQMYQTEGTLALQPVNAPERTTFREGNVIFLEQQRQGPLGQQIDHFDKNYQKEGLSRDWWNINDVGFSMKRQMDLLQRSDPMSVSKWAEQTERDFLGFALEYLVKRKVFPFEYRVEGGRFIDEKYGNREMLEMIDPREREGVVLETARQAKRQLLEGNDVAIVSPKGKAGIAMDDGREIEYPDTMVFYMQRKGDKIIGTGFSLGFNLEEARQLVEKLTGKTIPKTASAVDCVKELATFGEESEIKSPYDLIEVVKTIKDEARLSGIVTDLGRRETLYNFDIETRKIIQEFKDYVTFQELSELEIQKAVTATLLRLSKYMLDNQRKGNDISSKVKKEEMRFLPTTYGQIMDEVRKIPGCAGGGGSTSSISSIINRSVNLGLSDKEWFTCPKCSYKADGPIGNTCPGCGLTKEDYAQESGDICE
ncbi:MAG: hypothetical protein M1444_00830 [Patescibacteria group bacterium]|nr:hypothetical protein [Patescibacteria group bacterium]